ncbi:MAG TPA: winged helix-turn-helix domain-containing protein, partial [Nitrososphaera sp.]|nr:winged helix-turn-helix domain-containing protein [Nitrososphaera sp.]
MAEQNMDEFPLDETVTIFSNEDADLKLLGELLSNESSRAILMLLSEQEMTASELARTIGISLSVTLHHLDKMC